MNGQTDIQKAIGYVYKKQEIIRLHENAQWLKEQGVDLVLGEGKLTGKDEVIVNEKKYSAKKIVLATGSKPRRLKIPGVELGWQIHSPG